LLRRRQALASPQDNKAELDGPRLLATGGHEYLVILTIGDGPPPKVEAEAGAPAGRVTVGGQKVRFDGEKIIVGD
jgi:hypothetical protein